MPIKIDYKKCCWKDGKCISAGCGSGGCSCSASKECNGCVEVCPSEALKRGKLVEFDKSKCIDCGACIAACSHEAISFA
jgi:NAD-dependent dihydropyrimidine dehydrogenase PreA subunit